MTAPAHSDSAPRDGTAFALLICVALSLAIAAGWALSDSPAVQAALQAVGFGRTAAIEAEQRDQAASLARLEQAMRVVVGDVASLKLRDTVSRPDPLLETRLGLLDDAVNSLKTRAANGAPAGETWRGTVDRLDAGLARDGIEIDALRTSIDGQQQSYRASFAAMAKRIDHIETLLASRDLTGSIRPASPRPKVRHRLQVQAAPRLLAGWTITHAEPGFAVVRGQDGTFTASPGSVIPRLGRVTEVRQSENRWLIATEKGLIGQ